MRIIDCDTHPYPNDSYPIEPFIPDAARLAIEQHQDSRPTHGFVNPFGLLRRDVTSSDPDVLRERVLDGYDVDYAVLISPGLSVSITPAVPVASAMAQAYNDWIIECFLEKDPRFLAAVSVNLSDPEAAVREIHRAGEHPQMVQICVTGEAELLYGHPMYGPVFEACQEKELVVALHPGPEGSITPSTPVGRPRSYAEWHSGLPMTYQAQVINMVMEGVFERYPGIKVLLIEGGIAWLPHVMWRMDKNFKALRTTLPWLKRLPSEYVVDHIRLTTQPLEEPGSAQLFANLLEMVRAEKTLCFSSDFPHWDMDDPYRAFPRGLDEALQRRIFSENAAELYGLSLPAARSTEAVDGRSSAARPTPTALATHAAKPAPSSAGGRPTPAGPSPSSSAGGTQGVIDGE